MRRSRDRVGLVHQVAGVVAEVRPRDPQCQRPVLGVAVEVQVPLEVLAHVGEQLRAVHGLALRLGALHGRAASRTATVPACLAGALSAVLPAAGVLAWAGCRGAFWALLAAWWMPSRTTARPAIPMSPIVPSLLLAVFGTDGGQSGHFPSTRSQLHTGQ